MKNRFLLPLIVLSLAAMFAFACKNESNTTTDTSATTDTSTTMSTTDTSATTSTSGTTGTTVSAMDPADTDFMTKAAIGGMFEVNAGQLASSKGTNADVKAFGDRMTSDHGKANDELKALAATKGVTLPTDLDAEHKKKMDDLSSKSGKAFDKAYMKEMVDDHEKDTKEFEKESKDAKDADLKTWAAKTLPTLQDHLKMAKATAAKVK